MSTVDRAREYERNYHERLYADHELFEPGTWLHKPAMYALKSFEFVPRQADVRVLDLGGGVGRHSILAAKHFGPTSKIDCVDLLDTAITRLTTNAQKQGVGDNITGIVADVETFDLGDKPYGLILSISCIEHVPTKARLEQLIQRLQSVTVNNGVNCFMMMTDIEWINPQSGETLTPIIEQNLSSEETMATLNALYCDWQIHDISTNIWQVEQPMDGDDVILKSTCVQFTAQK